MKAFGFAPVAAEDFEALLALRIAALRPSLEALGRFDPVRARARFQGQFEPGWMRHLLLGGERVGLLTLRPAGKALHLDHLYLLPAAQGQGLGAWALDQAQQQARAAKLPIELEALRGSAANRFYLRHGFVQVSEAEMDLHYRWEPLPC